MISLRRAWPLALAALCLSLACPAAEVDDGSTGANESGSNDAGATADETAADDSAALGCAADITFDTTDGATESVMQTWGAACTTDQECKDLIGDPDAICDAMAVVYELPGGYCSKPCTLPAGASSVSPDALDCDPNGGVACIGVSGQFERCAIICTDDMQCTRPGYECRQMPLIAMAEDPTLCLMPECCQGSCAEE